MKKFIATLIFLFGIIFCETLSAEKYIFDIINASKEYGYSEKEELLNDKYLEINILKGTSYQLPLMKFTLAKSSSSSSPTEVIWFEKGKSQYYTIYQNQGKYYYLRSSEFKNVSVIVYVPDNNSSNGMVQFVHLNANDEPVYDTAAFISRTEALRIENIIKQQLKNLNFRNLK